MLSVPGLVVTNPESTRIEEAFSKLSDKKHVVLDHSITTLISDVIQSTCDDAKRKQERVVKLRSLETLLKKSKKCTKTEVRLHVQSNSCNSRISYDSTGLS